MTRLVDIMSPRGSWLRPNTWLPYLHASFAKTKMPEHNECHVPLIKTTERLLIRKSWTPISPLSADL